MITDDELLADLMRQFLRNGSVILFEPNDDEAQGWMVIDGGVGTKPEEDAAISRVQGANLP